MKINFPNTTDHAVPVGSIPAGGCFMKVGATGIDGTRWVYVSVGKAFTPARPGQVFNGPSADPKVLAVILETGCRATLRPEELVTPVEAELNVISIGRKPE